MPQMIQLFGCTPEPIAAYLKAVGVLRVLTHQHDSTITGCWQQDVFCLETTLTPDSITEFFLNDYQPTPLVAPWNGSTGFYPKDKAQKKLLNSFCESTAQRFNDYKATITTAQGQVNALGLTKQATGEAKQKLLMRLRNTLPETALPWLEACALVTGEEAQFPPLLGTGGNDGNFEFSRTFMQQLGVVLDIPTGKPTPDAEGLLKAALFAAILPNLNYTGKIGQFDPMAAGGANAAPGFDGESRVNPWDFILMLEGAMLFVAGATRRYEQDISGALSYPFTVRPSNVGYASAALGDKSRAEIWLPLWENFTPWEDLQALFREGRAKFNQRMAVDGVDFACAIAQLGITRGITEFIRYSFQERNGLSYFAIPLGRFTVQSNPQMDLLAPLDGWLRRLKGVVNADNTPASLKQAHRRLETAILKLAKSTESQRGEKLLDILISLGEVEATLDRAYRTKEAKDKALSPLSMGKNSFKWLQECRENSPEFHLALALAGQTLRERLVWVRYNEKGQPYWLDHDDKRTVWRQGATLEQNLIAWLKRLDIETQQQEKNNEKPEENTPTPPTVSLKYLYQWLMGVVDTRRIEALARGLSLLNLQNPKPSKPPEKRPIPASYALLKLVHYRHLSHKRLNPLATNLFNSKALPKQVTLAAQPLPPTPGLLTQLAMGNEARAIQLAARRLQGSGLRPFTQEGLVSNLPPPRLAAALAFPIAAEDILRLLAQVQKNTQNQDKNQNQENENHDNA